MKVSRTKPSSGLRRLAMRSANSRGRKAMSPTPTHRPIQYKALVPQRFGRDSTKLSRLPYISRIRWAHRPATNLWRRRPGACNRTPASVASESMARSLELLEQARRCRRLAHDCTDGEVRETLLRLANEYSVRAATLEHSPIQNAASDDRND